MTRLAERPAASSGNRATLLLVISLVPGIAVAVGALMVVPQFVELFQGLGFALPLPTRVLLESYRYWGIAPVLTLALWAAWPHRARRGDVAVVFGSVVAGALFLFGAIACYAPIFMLARDAG